MDFKKTEELLRKYWECETSLEEERHLHEYFSTNEVPDSLKEAGALFQYFHEQRKKSIGEMPLDNQVTMSISKPRPAKQRVGWIHNTMRIAAGVAVLMVAIWFVHSEISKSQPPELVDTYSDPNQAFEETKKALLMISKSFGTAQEQTKKLDLFNEAREKVQHGGFSDEERKKDLKDS